MTSDFVRLGVRPELGQALRLIGVTEPTPIQAQAIPLLLAGRDVAAQAHTGTGKTLAFVLPILERIEPKRPFTQALIVTPTRELAQQIARETERLAAVVGAGVLAVYGGQDVERQMRKLENVPSIVVGTPGRLLDHVRRDTLSLAGVKMLVLDEADEMLRMGFLDDVETIVSLTSPKRQTMLFSATMPEPVRALAARYMRKPEQLRIAGKQVTLDEIEQSVVETTETGKTETLCRLIERHRPFLAMVFCSTKSRAAAVNDALRQRGIASDALHGDLSQAKREHVLKRFREAKLQVLVATDVAARGLDIAGVTHVYNYDMPRDVEGYIHRIGRTGRAGEAGVAVTFATLRDRVRLAKLERGIGMALARRNADGELLASAVAKKPAAARGAAGSAARGSGAANKPRQAASGHAGRAGDGGRGSRGGGAASRPLRGAGRTKRR